MPQLQFTVAQPYSPGHQAMSFKRVRISVFPDSYISRSSGDAFLNDIGILYNNKS